MSYTTKELDAAISDEDGAGVEWEGSWYEFQYASKQSKRYNRETKQYEPLDNPGVDVPGFGWAIGLEQYGGEGQGDDLWQVFSVTDNEGIRYFRKGGWHASFSGGSYDQDLEEVTPQAKVITEWVKL